MKNLLITLLLISPFSFADWGDVYYCQMTSVLDISAEGEITNYTLEKFQFKLDETKSAMVFGKESFVKNLVLELREGMNFPAKEMWYARDRYTSTKFEGGKFLYSLVGDAIQTMSATCDKF